MADVVAVSEVGEANALEPTEPLANRHRVCEGLQRVREVGEAHPAVQVPDCELALAHGTGGSLATRMGSATLILGRDA